MAEVDTENTKEKMAEPESIYNFIVTDIDGTQVDLKKYEGYVCLIVNVASQCGYTDSNYPALEELYQKYKDQKFVVLAFPCNQFGNQESACERDIKKFTEKFKISFDMFSKINVNGDDADALYKYLKKQQGGMLLKFIKWNFTKFLVNRQGIPVKRYAPTESFKKIEEDIQKII